MLFGRKWLLPIVSSHGIDVRLTPHNSFHSTKGPDAFDNKLFEVLGKVVSLSRARRWFEYHHN